MYAGIPCLSLLIMAPSSPIKDNALRVYLIPEVTYSLLVYVTLGCKPHDLETFELLMVPRRRERSSPGQGLCEDFSIALTI